MGDYDELRAAIAAGPTKGPWKWSQGEREWELVGERASRVLFRWGDSTGLGHATIRGESLNQATASLDASAPSTNSVTR